METKSKLAMLGPRLELPLWMDKVHAKHQFVAGNPGKTRSTQAQENIVLNASTGQLEETL